ncbi:MAG: sulfurtransferase complex subunit TusB [Pseudomonadales bacterium]
MILHTINKSPFNSSCFSECLALCSANSSVLLLEDGVYAAQAGTDSADTISRRTDINFYLLAADVNARALNTTLCGNITVVNDHGFVELAASHHTVQSWY